MHLGGGSRAGRVFYMKGWVRESGDGVVVLQAGCIPRPEPKPALGLDNTASMLSPKGDHDRKVGGAWRWGWGDGGRLNGESKVGGRW